MSDDQVTLGYFLKEKPAVLEDDLIIAFKAKPISKTKNILTSNQCKVYIKEPEGYRQIGLIQDLHITVGVKEVMANVSVSFPKGTSKLQKIDSASGKCTSAIITKNKKALTALGVNVK